MHQRPSNGYSRHYKLGVEMSKLLEPRCTLRELGDHLGITKQNAYTESVLALGKFVAVLKRRLVGGPHALNR